MSTENTLPLQPVQKARELLQILTERYGLAYFFRGGQILPAMEVEEEKLNRVLSIVSRGCEVGGEPLDGREEELVRRLMRRVLLQEATRSVRDG